MLRRTATPSFQNAIHSCYYQLYPHAMQMQDNGPQGSIIFDTEAQTLSTANHLDCGNFDDMLRKAFEHENIESSYKANGLIPIYIAIPNWLCC